MHFKRTRFMKQSSVDFLVEFRTARNPSTFFQKYNIIHNKDGTIYDLDLKRQFNCLYNWADTLTNNGQSAYEPERSNNRAIDV